MEKSIYLMYKEYVREKNQERISQIVNDFSESIKHQEIARGLAEKLVDYNDNYTEEQKISLLYDISKEDPKTAISLVTSNYKTLAIPLAQKVIAETEESFLLEKMPDLAYFIGNLLPDDNLKEKSRVPFVHLSCTDAYIFGKTYNDRLLKAYAREECIRSYFPE